MKVQLRNLNHLECYLHYCSLNSLELLKYTYKMIMIATLHHNFDIIANLIKHFFEGFYVMAKGR